MRLVRIEADRFGGIDARSLGDLSPGLTVVVGPNEAGKSSLTALVRYLLYGFPTPASSENPYLSAAGKRQGRLVFADEAGEWVIERVEGPHGGPVTVRALSGPPRDGLAAELTRGVSRAAYRVVFGFGLEEMQQIGLPTGKDDDLMSRLYAAGAGLTVSPPDIRAKLTERAETLWKKGGSVPRINRARSERDAVRTEIRQLEADADAFREDALRLAEAETALVTARRGRADAQARSELLARAVAEVDRLTAEATRAAATASELTRESGERRRAAEAIIGDAPALAVADAVRGLAVEAPGLRERLAAVADQLGRLDATQQRLGSCLDEAGWTEAQALAAAGDAGIAAEIEAARAELDKLRARAELAAEERDRAQSEAAGSHATRSAPESGGRRVPLPAIVAGVLGLAGVATGLALAQVALTVFGAIVAAAGLALAFVRSPAAATGPESAQSRVRVATARAAVEASERALLERKDAWASRVCSWGLGTGSEEPAAIAARLQAARDARGADRERAAIREALQREQERVESYAARVRAVVAPLLSEDVAAVTPDRCADLVARASQRVEAALQADTTRTDGLAEADRIAAEAAAARATSEAAAAAVVTVLAAAGIADGTVEDARLSAASARIEAQDAQEASDALAAEVASLRTKIDAESRQDRLEMLRLRDETLGELMAADVREYAVLMLATRLLSLAQARYERERQPEVLKRAQSAFATMTNGRYPRLSIPLGCNAIEVFTAAASGVGPDKLSRGTAEQLYLALRLGLVDQLGEVGEGLPVLMDDVLVNFSPDRLEPAAAAVADLARTRQVVFFTCHPAMGDLLCRVAPQAVRIDLEGPAAPAL